VLIGDATRVRVPQRPNAFFIPIHRRRGELLKLRWLILFALLAVLVWAIVRVDVWYAERAADQPPPPSARQPESAP